MPAVTEPNLPGVGMMGKKKSGGTPATPNDKQVNFRVPGPLNARLEAVAEILGLDVSNFLRLMLVQKLPDYEREAEKYRRPGD